MTPSVTQLPSWQALKAHVALVRPLHLRQLFAQEPDRGQRLAASAAGIYLDYSKHLVTSESLRLLLGLAAEADLGGQIAAMFRGDRINRTEDRAVLHTALRAPRGSVVLLDGRDVMPDVHAVLDRMASFAE